MQLWGEKVLLLLYLILFIKPVEVILEIFFVIMSWICSHGACPGSCDAVCPQVRRKGLQVQGKTCQTLGSKLCVSWWSSLLLKCSEGAWFVHPWLDRGTGRGAAHGSCLVQLIEIWQWTHWQQKSCARMGLFGDGLAQGTTLFPMVEYVRKLLSALA